MPLNRQVRSLRKTRIKPIIHKSNNRITPKHTIKQDRNVRTIQNLSPKRTTAVNHKNKINKIWDGGTVYLVAGGPSLRDFDWSQLEGKRTICINRSYTKLSDADVLYWTDSRFYRWYKSDIDKLNCIKVTCRGHSNMMKDDIILVKTTGKSGLDLNPAFIKAGSNSGFAAINVAYHLGATRIYLLGYDMQSSDKNTHWHDGYKIKHDHSIYKRNMISNFEGIHAVLKIHGIQIWNATKDSQINSIPKCTIESALADKPVSFN